MKHSPTHKWYYFPKMTPEQVILLKVSLNAVCIWLLLTVIDRHSTLRLMLLALSAIPHSKTQQVLLMRHCARVWRSVPSASISPVPVIVRLH